MIKDMDYATYYAGIEKPWFAPEPWVFGFAWGIIYPLIAVALVLVIIGLAQGKFSRPLLVSGLLVVNIVANLAFTPLQLNYPESWYALADIFVVLISLILLQKIFWREKRVVFYILVPYLLWGAFATVLQTTIYLMNFV